MKKKTQKPTKKVLHNALAHHPLINAQRVPEQQEHTLANSSSLTVQCDAKWCWISL